MVRLFALISRLEDCLQSESKCGFQNTWHNICCPSTIKMVPQLLQRTSIHDTPLGDYGWQSYTDYIKACASHFPIPNSFRARLGWTSVAHLIRCLASAHGVSYEPWDTYFTLYLAIALLKSIQDGNLLLSSISYKTNLNYAVLISCSEDQIAHLAVSRRDISLLHFERQSMHTPVLL